MTPVAAVITHIITWLLSSQETDHTHLWTTPSFWSQPHTCILISVFVTLVLGQRLRRDRSGCGPHGCHGWWSGRPDQLLIHLIELLWSFQLYTDYSVSLLRCVWTTVKLRFVSHTEIFLVSFAGISFIESKNKLEQPPFGPPHVCVLISVAENL